MSSLAIQTILELIERLRSAMVDFAAREQQLIRGLEARRASLERKYGAGTGEAKLAEQLAGERAALDAYEEKAKGRLAARRERIEKLRAQEMRAGPRRAREAREAFLGQQQWRQRNAEQTRTNDHQEAAAAFAALTERLNAAQGHIVKLQRKIHANLFEFQSLAERASEPLPLPPAEVEGDEERRLEYLEETYTEAETRQEDFAKLALPRLFHVLPRWAWVLLGPCVGAGVAALLGPGHSYVTWCGSGLVIFTLEGLLLHRFVWQRIKTPASELALGMLHVEAVFEHLRRSSLARYEQRTREIEETFTQTSVDIRTQWDRAPQVEREFVAADRVKVDAQASRAQARLQRLTHLRTKALAEGRAQRLDQLEQEGRARLAEIASEGERETALFNADESAKWQALESAWRQTTEPIYAQIAAYEREAAFLFPEWSEALAENWVPMPEFPVAVKLASVEVHAPEMAEAQPRDPRLALPGPANFTLPLALTFPQQGSLLFEARETASATINGCINNVILRLLATAPPGKVSFTIIDPVGLGQNFAGLMHLSDYEENIISRRIWTQPGQIEERLAELNEHIEKVIQMYLRNEYATITEYNAQAGSVAEKYHFVVAADFPAGFSEVAARRLQSIATSGPRCGVFTLIHWDRRRPLPEGLVIDEVRKNSVVVKNEQGMVNLARIPAFPGIYFHLDTPARPELASSLVHKIGRASIDSSRVEVPFAQIAPSAEERWKSETTQELRVPIGRTGATKLQYLAIGKGTRQHALFAGKTGSGKSTLFHVIITNLALWCSPEQVEFYLIDFKKGVEFKCYADHRLPHARVVAIESDREFALSVLQRVDEELRRRGDLFRKLGVQDIAGYQRAPEGGAREPMPRTLLIIDEFQEFFTEDDPIAQSASLLFDRIVRQGRAFGIHVLLGSQTLGGAYTLARATLGQMVIRVALQCNEADAYLIMDENNAAPRLLSRPGEGIYNDSAGAVEGNSPFQVVWLSDDERDRWLDQVRELAVVRRTIYPSPIVFEGNSPAAVRENDLLRRVLTAVPTAAPVAARCWLGAPNSIKGPTEAVFHRQSGNNLLLVGQNEEATCTMLGLALLTLAAQFPPGRARFVFFLSAAPGSAEAAFIEQIAEARSGQIEMVLPGEAGPALAGIAAELKARMDDEVREKEAPPIFVFLQGLHRFKKLRQEEDFSFSSSEETVEKPGAQFNELMLEGSAHGIHLLAGVDTFNSANRFINRRALSEWEMRVVFQMSANDSASLIDSPLASNLGLHRAIFYNERAGSLETFRPYAMPDEGWLAEVTRGADATKQILPEA